ncbi:hypothetical protein DPMN_005372 [Dreissena polymorpha]|uniref:Uncharacterized protein n=1 Tax=Dreissena polymorpha TaxID=45954 RepID=A0A9D4RTU5_DREPO|nr:hypothetical protein DPMN_005372 [Dreissena polymorpha]
MATKRDVRTDAAYIMGVDLDSLDLWESVRVLSERKKRLGIAHTQVCSTRESYPGMYIHSTHTQVCI